MSAQCKTSRFSYGGVWSASPDLPERRKVFYEERVPLIALGFFPGTGWVFWGRRASGRKEPRKKGKLFGLSAAGWFPREESGGRARQRRSLRRSGRRKHPMGRPGRGEGAEKFPMPWKRISSSSAAWGSPLWGWKRASPRGVGHVETEGTSSALGVSSLGHNGRGVCDAAHLRPWGCQGALVGVGDAEKKENAFPLDKGQKRSNFRHAFLGQKISENPPWGEVWRGKLLPYRRGRPPGGFLWRGPRGYDREAKCAQSPGLRGKCFLRRRGGGDLFWEFERGGAKNPVEVVRSCVCQRTFGEDFFLRRRSFSWFFSPPRPVAVVAVGGPPTRRP